MNEVGSVLELRFPIVGDRPCGDHAYAFYAAVSASLDRHLPDHILVSHLSFPHRGPGRTGLVRFRMPATEIGPLVGLAGQAIRLGDGEMLLGVPLVQPLRPAESLRARLIVIKPPGERPRAWLDDPDEFLDLASRSLQRRGIAAAVRIPTRRWGPYAGTPTRRVLGLKGIRIPGYALEVSGLTPQDSLTLQATGLGGRLHYGCGFFLPPIAGRRSGLDT